MPQIALDEVERTATQIRHLDQVGKDPVAVQLEQRDQVHEDDEVVDQREAIEERGEAAARRGNDHERGDAGQDHLRVGPRERLHDPLTAIQHQAVGGVDEERRRAEEDEEPRAEDTALVVGQRHRVPELVREGQEQPEGEEDQCLARGGVDRQLIAPRLLHADERDKADQRDERSEHHQHRTEEELQPSVVRALHEALGAPPGDPQVLREVPQLPPPGRGSIKVHLHERLHIRSRRIEEPALAQRHDQSEHRGRVQIAGRLKVIDDQFLGGLGPIHLLHERRFPRLELEVQGVVGAGGDGEVVAPAHRESLDLGAGRQHRRERLGVEHGGELVPQPG